MRVPMACSKVDKDPKDPEELEELRHLTFQESIGTREVKDTISGDIKQLIHSTYEVVESEHWE
jgi:hypothetical protein